MPFHSTIDNNGVGASNWVDFTSIQYIVKTLHSLDCYRWSLQKQVGCFNYKVVTLVAYKLERQWRYERYRRQKYFQSNPRGCCSCSSSYHQNTLKPLKTYAKIYYKCTIQNCSMELSCSWGKQLGDSLPDVLTIFMQCIRWIGQQTSLSHHFYATACAWNNSFVLPTCVWLLQYLRTKQFFTVGNVQAHCCCQHNSLQAYIGWLLSYLSSEDALLAVDSLSLSIVDLPNLQ